MDYIRIPCLSAGFDEDWQRSRYLHQATMLLASWCNRQCADFINPIVLQVMELEGRSPLLFIEVPAYGGQAPPPAGTILLYGHLDKQPPSTGWDEGLSAWEPVRRGNRLYGRGSADDGYAVFAALSSLKLLREQGVPHARCVILIESGEESGSPDLPAYIEHLAERIGQPDLAICLDASCADYEHLWLTTSLRGVVMGKLRVEVLTQGVHSGEASGLVPSSFSALRLLLDRIEDPDSGQIRLRELFAAHIPEIRVTQAHEMASTFGKGIFSQLPWAEGSGPRRRYTPGDLLINRTWAPALEITGADGLPPLNQASNILRPFTEVMLSMRLPPTVDPTAAAAALKHTLEEYPPHGARVSFTTLVTAPGWDAPPLAPWLDKSVQTASRAIFGRPPMALGEGGTIPFMAMLGQKFPAAQFIVTGVLGPHSNAHGPNEFLNLETAERLTVCVASIIADHVTRV